MKPGKWIPLAAALALLTSPPAPFAMSSAKAVGGNNWLCFAYGALAGASILSGSLPGALGFGMAAARAGCFG